MRPEHDEGAPGRMDDPTEVRPAGAAGDALHRLPHALVRHGGLLLLVAAVLVLGVAAIIEFPETVEAEFSLVGSDPPVAVVAAGAGRLQLEVEDGEIVQAGTVVGTVGASDGAESAAAAAAELTRAARQIDVDGGTVVEFDMDVADAPESLRPELVRLERAVRLYDEHLDPASRAVRRATLRREMNYHEELAARQVEVNRLLEGQVELAGDLLRRYGRAKERGLVTVEHEVERAQALARERQALEEGRAQLRRHRHDARNAEVRLDELERRWSREEADGLDEVRAAQAALLEALTAWDREVLLRAPVGGRVALFDYRTDGHRLTAGDTVLLVVPPIRSPWAHVEVPAATVARIETGRPVRLQFHAFPSSRFGHVDAHVGAISEAAKGDSYALRVELADELRTTSGHPIPPRQGAVGTAEIVIRSRSLLSRILGL